MESLFYLRPSLCRRAPVLALSQDTPKTAKKRVATDSTAPKSATGHQSWRFA